MTGSESASIPMNNRLRSSCSVHSFYLWCSSLALAASVAWDATAQTSKPTPKNRDLEQSLFFDVRPSAPDQSLSKFSERKADAEAAFMQGLILEEDGDYDSALTAYTKSLQLDPGGNPQIAIRVANEYVKREDFPSALDLLKDLVKVRPDQVQALLNLADIYLQRLGKADLALPYAEQALRLAPDRLAPYQAMFEINFALNRKKNAEAILQRAQKLESQDPATWLTLTDLSIRLYSSEKGVFQASHSAAVEPYLKKAAALAKDDVDVLSKVGDAYVEISQVSNAITAYLKALEVSQGNTEIRYKLAQSFLKTGQRDEAIRTLEEMIKTNSLRPESYEFLARLYQEGGNLERALSNYQQAILLAPNQPENYLHAAEMQLELKKFDDAILTLQRARHQFPVPQMTYSLAVALSTAKRYSDALPIYEAALQEAKTAQPEVLDAAFYFNYAVAAEQSNLVDKAAGLFKQCIELDPSKAAQAYNYLGYMYVDRNINLDEAGVMIKKALELQPDNGAYIDSLGWYYFHTGDYAKALTELLRAVERLKPEDPIVLEHVGDTYQALNNLGEADVYWQRALKLDPANQKLATKIDASKAKLTSNPPSTATPLPTTTNDSERQRTPANVNKH
jgi:tetratricopeptide (TPR) repeat protein